MGGNVNRKINRSSGISAQTNLGRNNSAPSKEIAAEPPASKDGETLPGKDSGDGFRGYHGSKSSALDKEFSGLMRMVQDGNQKIRENSGKLNPDEQDADDASSVPSVLGFTVNAATQTLGEAGLAVAKLTRQHHSRIPVGRVLSQYPEAGKSAKGVAAVNLVVSAGAKL